MFTQKYNKIAKNYDQKWHRYNQGTIGQLVKHCLDLQIDNYKTILDIGCGTGNLLRSFSRLYPHLYLYGIEPSINMLQLAQLKLPTSARLLQAFAEEIPYPDQSFDLITSNSMFHYVKKPETVLAEVHRCLNDRGSFVITDWCYDSPMSKVNNLMLRLSGDYYNKIYRRSEMEKLLVDNNFTITQTTVDKIDFYWQVMTFTAQKKTL